MDLINANSENLKTIQDLVRKMGDHEIIQPLEILHGSSIGQHIRHILEFYSCLTNRKDTVCYDKRERNLMLETNRMAIDHTIDELVSAMSETIIDTEIIILMSFDAAQANFTPFTSSYFRELAYCLEHTVHHSAIIKIALTEKFKHISVANQFGVAYSTLRNRIEKECAQ